MKTVIKISFMLFLGFSLNAQNFNREKMDSLFLLINENDKGMGSVSIYKNGNEIYSNTIGFADIEKQKLADSQTKYRVGSISKTFTAAVVMQLIEEGKLQLDTKLENFYPQFPNSGIISIKDMLRHQSGLFNFSSAEDFKQWKGQQQSKNQYLERISKNPAVFKPGEKSEYSNTNYVLLSFIIEDIEKKDLSEVIDQRIIEPLKLKNTYYGGKLDSAKGEALAYEKTGEWTPVEETEISLVKGAGAMTSTPSDINKFFSALLEGKVVKPESLAKMTEIRDEYGLGIFEMPIAGKTFFGHTGGIDGFNSVVVYDPEEKTSIAYSSNAREMAPHKIFDAIVHIYLGEKYELPVFKTLTLTAEQLKQFEGIYSAEGFPFELTIFEENGQLMGQAAGQPSFPLEAYEVNKFKFDRLGLKLEFDPAQEKMIFKQGPNTHELKRA